MLINSDLDYYCIKCDKKVTDVQVIRKSYVGYYASITVGFCPEHGLVECGLSLKAKKT
jgi:hypothetical protein